MSEHKPQYGIAFNKAAAFLLCRRAAGRPLDSMLTNLIDNAIEGADLAWYPGCPVADVQNFYFIFAGEAGNPENVSAMMVDLHLNKSARQRLEEYRSSLPGGTVEQVLQARLEEWCSQEFLPWSDAGCRVESVHPLSP